MTSEYKGGGPVPTVAGPVLELQDRYQIRRKLGTSPKFIIIILKHQRKDIRLGLIARVIEGPRILTFLPPSLPLQSPWAQQ